MTLMIIVAGGCQREHEVRILLGPDDETLTQGFVCRDENGNYLAERARVGNQFHFSLVVDLIDLGGFPGCRGEEILLWCSDRGCNRVRLPDGRFCVPINLSITTPEDLPAAVGQIYQQLAAAGPIVVDAPAFPVLVQAVATTQDCAELAGATSEGYPGFAPDQLIGCATSCPVVLDNEEEVQLFLDTLSVRCSDAVVACANGL